MSAELTEGYCLACNLPYYEEGWNGSGNLEYRNERCKLDLYYPAGDTDFVTVVWFHGGGLQSGEKEIPKEFRNRDVAVVAPNYRLSSARAKCPDYLEDAAAAVAWVFNHIGEYGGDPDKIYVSGGSGGGYLVAMLALVPEYLGRHGISPMKLAGVMPISGQMTTHFQIVNERAGVVAIGPNLVTEIDEFAPLHHIRKDTPPLTLYVGDPAIEWPARPEENQLLAAMLTRVAGNPRVKCVSLPGFDHGDVYPPSFMLMLKEIQAVELQKFLAAREEPQLEIRSAILSAGQSGPDENAWHLADWGKLTTRAGKSFAPDSKIAFLYDENFLYFRFDGGEPSPERMVQKVTGHDAIGLWEGDCVDIYLSPDPGAPEKAFQLIVAPDGSVYDADFGAFGGSGPGWNPQGVRVSSHIADQCWIVELVIPFAEIGGRPKSGAMSGNVYRHRLAGGSDQSANWSPTMIMLNHFPQAFGRFVFTR